MTKEEIISMAREAGFERLGVYAQFGDDWVCFTEELIKFADLIQKYQRKEWAKEFAGFGNWSAVHLLEEAEK